MSKTYTLTRTGTIRVSRGQWSETQCGKMRHTKYWYEISVSIEYDKLDDSGFVIDHKDLHKAAVDAFGNHQVRSCERMASYVAQAVAGIVPHYLHINVRLGALRRWPFGKGMGHTSFTISK